MREMSTIAFGKNSKLLETYLKNLENNPPIQQWTKNDSLAYFINVYNAVTVKLILIIIL